MNYKSKNGILLVKLPAAGLGNMLFVWARGIYFAKKYNLEYHVTPWFKASMVLKNILKKETRKRNYASYFNRKKNYSLLLKAGINGTPKLYDPVFDINKKDIENKVIIFSKIAHWSNLFEEIRDQRPFIIDQFYGMLDPKILKEAKKYPNPVIAVHVRLGDFTVIKEGETLKDIGGCVRTPFDYFIKLIEKIRQIHGSKLPVTIFSNGTKAELLPLLNLGNVDLFPDTKYDVIDIIVMSRSNLLIPSALSTFSMWAAYLNNIPVINHKDRPFGSIRDAEANKKYFEGSVNEDDEISKWPPLLIKNIRNIVWP